MATALFLLGAGGSRIAYVRHAGAPPVKAGVIFFPGLLSNMQGFDYTGHGLSSGTFPGTHLGDWFRDALLAVDSLTDEAAPLVVVGSSMGGLLALHAALQRPARVAALVLAAPAVGLADRLWDRLGEAKRRALLSGGAVNLGSDYVAPGADEVSLAFFEEARAFALPEAPGSLNVRCPVRILHGALDDVVSVEVGQRLVSQLAGDDVVLTIAKDGDHRLSSQRDIGLLMSAVAQLVESLPAAHQRD